MFDRHLCPTENTFLLNQASIDFAILTSADPLTDSVQAGVTRCEQDPAVIHVISLSLILFIVLDQLFSVEVVVFVITKNRSTLHLSDRHLSFFDTNDGQPNEVSEFFNALLLYSIEMRGETE